MKKITSFSVLCCCIVFGSVSHGAKLCAKISSSSAWSGGVFSVVDANGITLASTRIIASGSEGCTENVKNGDYVIRFNGAYGPSVLPFDGVYGCLSSVFEFRGDRVVSIVFNKGEPPFNGNQFCTPSEAV